MKRNKKRPSPSNRDANSASGVRRPASPTRTLAVLGVALIALSPGLASAQSLMEALSQAYASNPGLDAERSRQRADKELVRQEWANHLPQITLDASRGEEKTRTNGSSSSTTLKPDSYELTLTQPLFRGFQTLNGTKRAKSEVLAGAAQLHDREQQVLLDGVTTYADVLNDRKVLSLRRANVSFLRDALKATRARKRAGDVSRTDVAQAKTRLFEGQADLAQAEANIEISEANFEAVVGARPHALVQPQIPEHLLPHSLDEAIRMAASANPNNVRAWHQKEAANRAKREAYGSLLPNVSLELKHGVEHNTSTSVDKEEESSVFVRMRLPLFQGGANYSRIRESRARETGAGYSLIDAHRRTRASVIDAWKQYHSAKSRIRAAKQQRSAAKDALRGVQIEVKVGERALFELLDAQRELVNAQVALANANRDHVVSAYTLLSSVGRLTAAQLALWGSPTAEHVAVTEQPSRLPRAIHTAGKKSTAKVATKKKPAVQLRSTHAALPESKPAQAKNTKSPPVVPGYWLQTVEGPKSKSTKATRKASKKTRPATKVVAKSKPTSASALRTRTQQHVATRPQPQPRVAVRPQPTTRPAIQLRASLPAN